MPSTKERLTDGYSMLSDDETLPELDNLPPEEISLYREQGKEVVVQASARLINHKKREFLAAAKVFGASVEDVPVAVIRLVAGYFLKHCTSCGEQIPYNDETADERAKQRRCQRCLKNKTSKLSDRGGKFCRNCGKFYTIDELKSFGVSVPMGLNTWASCWNCHHDPLTEIFTEVSRFQQRIEAIVDAHVTKKVTAQLQNVRGKK